MKFKPKAKFGISMIMAFIMLFQIVGPVVYAYADSGLGFEILDVDIADVNQETQKGNAIVHWQLTLDADYESEEYTYPANFTVEEAKTGQITLDDGTVIGEYTVSEDGVITVTTDENLKDAIVEEEGMVPETPEVPEVPKEEVGEGNSEDVEATEEQENEVLEETEAIEKENQEEVKNVAMQVAFRSSLEDSELENDKTPKILRFEGSFVVKDVTKKSEKSFLYKLMPLSGETERELSATELNIENIVFKMREGQDIKDDDKDGVYLLELGVDKLTATFFDLSFDFSLEDEHDVKAGDYYTFTVPTAFKLDKKEDEPIKDGDIIIAYYSIDTDGKITITFTEAVTVEVVDGSGLIGQPTKGTFNAGWKLGEKAKSGSLKEDYCQVIAR